MAHPKHEPVRRRYDYRCGYCGVSEADTGGELTVDHYQPVSAGGSDEDHNLVYACIRCNLYKGDFFPDALDQAHGRRVLHPIDEISVHIHENAETQHLEPHTETGRFHIALLQLNRPALVENRLRRRLSALLTAKQQLMEAENAQLHQIIAAQASYISLLQRMLGIPPEDAA